MSTEKIMTHFLPSPLNLTRFYQKLAITVTASFFILLSGPLQAEKPELDESIEKAITLKPDLANGKKLYHNCALCHTPEGWGTPGGRYPQIAGQHQSVILKQLADIHSRNRDNPTMYPFATYIFDQGAQALADVSAYISKLPMVPNNSVGAGTQLDEAEKLYKDNCVKCHGENGEGDAKEFYPRIHGQHYQYVMRQMHWIKIGKRRNADEKMVKQIEGFTLNDLSIISDYVSRLQPDKELLADHLDWRNPDFRSGFISAPNAQKELEGEASSTTMD